MATVAISIEDLSKRYVIGAHPRGYKTLRESLTSAVLTPWQRLQGMVQPETEELWALNGVNFEVKQGEVVGIIGRNGAGKSTLLKILSRITEPTRGRARIRGRVASLLEVGTGFHAELTGRENLFLNGAILGMTRSEITRKFDEIVAFAEVEQFIDTPVKRYSSGMYLRLAFAVAAHLEPEILVVDEVLAVGDAGFQNKCIGKMQEVASDGRTVLFVSHNLASLRSLCSRCVWIHGGKVRADGDVVGTIDQYLGDDLLSASRASLTGHPGRRPRATGELMAVSVRHGGNRDHISSGDPLLIEFALDVQQPVRRPRLVAWVHDATSGSLFLLDSNLQPDPVPSVSGAVTVQCRVDHLPVAPGQYFLTVGFGNALELTDVIDRAIAFEVLPSDFFGVGHMPGRQHGAFVVRGTWNCCTSETDSQE